MLKGAKRGTLQMLNGLGIAARVRESAWRRERLLIICYHGISLLDEHEWDSSLYMSAADFEGRLQSIARGGYAVLPLAVALERLAAKALDEPTVAITFDDGIYDFRERAHPLLERYGFPATVYLTTYYCEHQEPVFPAFCSYVLWKGREARLDSSGILDRDGSWELRTSAGRASALHAIVDYSGRHGLSATEKSALTRLIAQRLDVDYESLIAQRLLHLLNPGEVAELAARGVDFQLHTHRHYTPPDRALFLREIQDNRERIRMMAGSEPTHFCYPSGVHDMEWLAWLREAGVSSATTTVPGLASSGLNPLLLPRLVDTAHLAPVEFEAWLSGLGAVLPRRRSRSVGHPFSERVRIESAMARGAAGATELLDGARSSVEATL